MKTEKLNFESAEGHQLAARLDRPISGKPIAWALFAHCFTCTKNLKAIWHISNALTRQGIAVVRFDFTGLGESEGDFADTNFSSNVTDLLAAADYMREHFEAPAILIGHSLGGAAVLLAAADIEEAKAVVTIAAPAEPTHVLKHLTGHDDPATKDVIEVQLAGRPFNIKQQFLDDLGKVNMQDHIRNLKKALLIMHAPGDEIVGIDNAATIYYEALHPKSFISLDRADHLLTDNADAMYAGNMIAAWVQRYIEQPPIAELHTQLDVVTSTHEGAFLTEIKAGPHALLADEPEAAGGNDLGPDPYELLSAALGACTGMTLRMYADRKGWPLEEVKVHLKHQKVYAADLNEAEEGNKQMDAITREIELQGPLNNEQRAKLLEIATKCPVHKTLSEANVVIHTHMMKEV